MITQENIPYTDDEIKAMVKTCEKYNKALDRADTLMKKEGKKLNVIPICKYIFPEFDTVSEDERIRKEILNVFNQLDEGTTICGRNYDYAKWIAWLEKQGEQQGKSVLKAWKDMRLEVYQQASGNRHEPNYSDDTTKMFSLNDIDEIIEKISEQKLDDKVEPKFKVGDCFISRNVFEFVVITEMSHDEYICTKYRPINNPYNNNNSYLRKQHVKFKEFEDEYMKIAYQAYQYTVPDFNDYDELVKLPKEELEKQGENRPTDKVEPKFKPGDWIIFNGLILHIDEVVNGYYRTTSRGDGIHNSYDWNIDNAARLWTIQEAKDSDVLLEEETGEPFIYNGNRATYFSGYFLGAYCGIYNGEFNPYGNTHHWGKNSCPATQEQRELLFQKMKEAGYEWDAEKKEVKKIEVASKD